MKRTEFLARNAQRGREALRDQARIARASYAHLPDGNQARRNLEHLAVCIEEEAAGWSTDQRASAMPGRCARILESVAHGRAPVDDRGEWNELPWQVAKPRGSR